MANMTDPQVAAPLRISKSSIELLKDESFSWILSHYLQIGIALGFGAAICVLLYGARMLAMRLCQRRQSFTHWPQTIGRVFGVTKSWFIVLFAAKLVDGYA